MRAHPTNLMLGCAPGAGHSDTHGRPAVPLRWHRSFYFRWVVSRTHQSRSHRFLSRTSFAILWFRRAGTVPFIFRWVMSRTHRSRSHRLLPRAPPSRPIFFYAGYESH